MTSATGRTTRVIGLYHSHPHITVLPSHVDMRTQAMYQLLDSGFIGLIFSCFSEDVHKVGRIQVIAFQSLDGKQSHMLRALPFAPVKRSAILDLESSLSSSENALTRSGSTRTESLEQDTGDSRVTAGAFKINYSPAQTFLWSFPPTHVSPFPFYLSLPFEIGPLAEECLSSSMVCETASTTIHRLA
ncbi:uncharacterized protein LOC114292460 [Camellia sinensis]|uniref:uncharacterized protein LOC114292460 n=1 Tax=Camellia sinensis TaxID=4442 RepID=UPI001035BE23|nr:uncharacterized protein LOC114292460 [Camellia sinensis]